MNNEKFIKILIITIIFSAITIIFNIIAVIFDINKKSNSIIEKQIILLDNHC